MTTLPTFLQSHGIDPNTVLADNLSPVGYCTLDATPSGDTPAPIPTVIYNLWPTSITADDDAYAALHTLLGLEPPQPTADNPLNPGNTPADPSNPAGATPEPTPPLSVTGEPATPPSQPEPESEPQP